MPKSKKEVKIDLTLLKKLVGELESNLATADGIREEKTDTNVYDYVVEMSKSMGIAAGIVQEATMLVGDIQFAVKHNTSGAGKDESLSSLLSILKGGSEKPGSN